MGNVMRLLLKPVTTNIGKHLTSLFDICTCNMYVTLSLDLEAKCLEGKFPQIQDNFDKFWGDLKNPFEGFVRIILQSFLFQRFVGICRNFTSNNFALGLFLSY